MLTVVLVVVLLLVIAGYLKRDWLKAKVASMKKEPSPEKLAKMQAAQAAREERRRHPSRLTLFARRAGEFLGALGIALSVAAVTGLIGGGFFHFAIIKGSGIENASYLSIMAFVVSAYAGGALTWAARS